MLKEQAKLFSRIAALVDMAAIVAAFLLAYQVRRHVLNPFPFYLWVLLVIIPVWYFLMARFGLYASIRTRPLSQVLASLAKVHVIGGIMLTSAIYLCEPSGYSRGLVGTFLAFSFLFIGCGKATLKGVLSYIRRRGYNVRHILIVGTDARALGFVDLLKQHANWGLKVVGVLALDPTDRGQEVNGCPVLGNLANLVEVCKRNPIDEVVFCMPKDTLFDWDEHVRDMEEMGITVRMVLDFYDVRRVRREFTFFHDEVPILTFYGKAFDGGQLFLKRCLDIGGALVGLSATAFLFPFIALAIRVDSSGPFFFGQNRVGENGRIFRCWKFRSMYLDAEERKQELMAHNEMSGAMFKMRDDPRITTAGRFLRRTSLDELPQYWNVLRGEMSLVGTRPPTPEEVATYENWHRKRICIKPGLTGLWQVSGRSEIQDFDEVARLDIQYIENWTLWLDIKLILTTVWVVFAGRGAS
jgi:exopolysaccharide biosynthesis polyprenyl glycosylphosphotransferase